MINDERMEVGLQRLLDPEAEGPAPTLDELARRRFAERVLQGFEAGEDLRVGLTPTGARPAVATSSRSLVARRVQGALAVAAALAAVTWLGLHTYTGGESEPPAVAVAIGELLEVPAGGRLALELDSEVELWLAGDTVARVADHGVTVHLERGLAVTRVSPRAGGERFRIVTPRGTIEVVGTLFAVEVDGEAVSVRVHEGHVRVIEVDGPTRELGPGEALFLGDRAIHAVSEADRALDQGLLAEVVEADGARADADSPGDAVDGAEAAGEELGVALERPADDDAGASAPDKPKATVPKASLDELVLAAARHRGERRWSAAAAAYKEIRRAYPDAPEACTALLSLGQLQLSHLDDQQGALRSFARHTKECRGPEREESRFGAAQALRELGRTSAERDALRGLIADFPASLRVDEARTRLGDLDRRAGRCGDAVAAYDLVLAGKPGATLERRARFGKADCGLQAGDPSDAKRFVARYPESAEGRELGERLADFE